MKKIIYILMCVLLVTGCGTNSNETAMNEAATDSMRDTSKNEVVEAEEFDAFENEVEEVTNQKFIVTYDISLETLNFDESISNMKEKVKELNGYIEQESIYTYDYGSYNDQNTVELRYGSFIVKIPETNSESKLDFTSEYEKVLSKSNSKENVTRVYNDTEIEVESLKAQEERLLTFMKDAKTVEEMLMIENQLSDVRMRLKQVSQQFETLKNQTSYATYEIEMDEVLEFSANGQIVRVSHFSDRLSNAFKEALDNLKGLSEFILFFIIRYTPSIALIWLLVYLLKKLFAKLHIQCPIKKRKQKQQALKETKKEE